MNFIETYSNYKFTEQLKNTMKLLSDINLRPYTINSEDEKLFYSQLNNFSMEIYTQAIPALGNIIYGRFLKGNIYDKHYKMFIIELLLMGILFDYYNQKTKNAKTVKYTVGNIHKMSSWLEYTQEYSAELNVIDEWIDYWESSKRKIFRRDFEQIIEFTKQFKSKGSAFLGRFFNEEFFSNTLKEISSSREDYYQVSKSLPEYLLNLLAACWLNEMHSNTFASHAKIQIMAPGCMRPNCGDNCKSKPDESYKICQQCNSSCNIYKLQKEAEEYAAEVRIVIHQSSFKTDVSQLENKAIIGIACTACLLGGGLMLKQNGIAAKCLVLNYPGCNKHWTKEGVATTISFSQLKQVLQVVEPKY